MHISNIWNIELEQSLPRNAVYAKWDEINSNPMTDDMLRIPPRNSEHAPKVVKVNHREPQNTVKTLKN